MNYLPLFLKPFFWDVSFSELCAGKNADFIIARILEKGDTKSLRWLWKWYNRNKISKVIKYSHNISKQTACFWSEVLNIDPREITCLQTQSPVTQYHF